MKRVAWLSLLTLAACDGQRAMDEARQNTAAPAEAPVAARSSGAANPAAAAPAPVTQRGDDWRGIATAADEARLARLDAAWREALAEARRGDAAALAALGTLAEPEVRLPRPHPAPGLYRCRTIKLGSQLPPGPPGSSLALVSYPSFRCRVDITPGGDLTLAKLTGSQRTTGQLYPDRVAATGADIDRLVYLGAQAWRADEASAPGYGRQAERDQIGVLERIGPDRYRLALPWPLQESKLDLLELERIG